MNRSTPGPWRRDGTNVLGADNQVVAVCRQAKPRNTMEAMGNAELIAGTLDAHEILTELRDWLDEDSAVRGSTLFDDAGRTWHHVVKAYFAKVSE